MLHHSVVLASNAVFHTCAAGTEQAPEQSAGLTAHGTEPLDTLT